MLIFSNRIVPWSSIALTLSGAAFLAIGTLVVLDPYDIAGLFIGIAVGTLGLCTAVLGARVGALKRPQGVLVRRLGQSVWINRDWELQEKLSEAEMLPLRISYPLATNGPDRIELKEFAVYTIFDRKGRTTRKVISVMNTWISESC